MAWLTESWPRVKPANASCGGQVEGHVVSRLALAQQETDALQVGGDIRHHQPPGVVMIEYRGRVEAPAGLAGLGRRVGPAMAHELIDALQEVEVGLGLHIERRGAEDRRMQPGPCFRRGDGAAVEMVGGRGPAGTWRSGATACPRLPARSTSEPLERVTGGIPYVCERNFVPCSMAHAVIGFR